MLIVEITDWNKANFSGEVEPKYYSLSFGVTQRDAGMGDLAQNASVEED